MATRLIISDPDAKFATKVQEFFTSNDYDVDTAANGRDCQLKLYKEKYFALILDLDTRNHSGFEVLKYAKLNYSSVKVLLTISSKKRFKDLEISEDDLKKLGACDVLVKPFKLESMKKSLEGVGMFESWKTIKQSVVSKSEQDVNIDDSQFTHIPIKDFCNSNTTIFDIYIRLNKNKYVKILHRGDYFDQERIDQYVNEQGITHLYFLTKERSVYVNFVNQLLAKMMRSNKASTEDKLGAAKSASEMYVEEIYTVGLRPQLIDEGKELCDHVYNMVKTDAGLHDLLREYIVDDESEMAHLFLTCFMSTIIGKNLDWVTSRTNETLGLGSFYHDIGILKLPKKLQEKKPAEMSEKELVEYRKHPEWGVDILKSYPSINEQIKQIVYQHHEYVNGEGYPKGITGIKIYPPAKIVCLANEFSIALVKSGKTPIEALRDFVTDKTNIFKYELGIVKALINGFRN